MPRRMAGFGGAGGGGATAGGAITCGSVGGAGVTALIVGPVVGAATGMSGGGT